MRCWTCLLLSIQSVVAWAGEPAAFVPPQVYPAERYEAGWQKNPFTLKTADALVAQGSFAKDLAIGSHYGAADNPTVVVVNTKTNERILLRKDRPGPGGMRLRSFHRESSRTACLAEIVLGAEAATIRYDVNYLGQMSANEVSRMAAAKKAATLPKLPLPAVKTPLVPSVPTAEGRQTLKVPALMPRPVTASTTSAPVLPLPKPIR